MRLVCPNCGAQYEVDDRVIPDSGRDVQCSSCGHGWYQMPAQLEASEQPDVAEPEAMVEAEDDAAGDFEPEAEAEAAPESDAEAAPIAETATEAVETEADAEAAPKEAPAQPSAVPEAGPPAEAAPDGTDETSADEAEAEAPPRRELDENLRAILQEEAAREMEARAGDGEPPASEPKPDLDLEAGPDAAGDKPGIAEAPSADVDDDAIPDLILPEKDTEPDAGAMAGAAAAAVAEGDQSPRRDLFPDIEEINSTLDTHGLPEEDVVAEDEVRRSGFSRGFFAIIFIAALALALYLVAPRLAESIPALEPLLTAYVGAVNGAREWLDGMVQGLTGRIGGPDQP